MDPATLTEDPELRFLLRSAENLGVTAEVLDLGSPLLPVVLARFTDEPGGVTRWAIGSGLGHREAVLEALRDLLGAEQMRRAGGESDAGDPLWADLDAATLVPDGVVPAPAVETTWPAVLDGLAAAGRDAFAVRVTAPDLAEGAVFASRVVLTRGTRRAH
ncbi:hypothetical protein GTY41_13305 [Streptomyces sp. SID685]|nr:hypothetical protein [Streptomyces sp. SID685]